MTTLQRIEKRLEDECEWTGGFKCPSCGGSHFGTSSAASSRDTDDWKVRCHDELNQHCQWSGPYNTPGIFVERIEWEEDKDTLMSILREELATALTVEDVISQGIESWARPYRFDERYHLGLGDIRVTPSMLDDLADYIKAAITEGEDD